MYLGLHAEETATITEIAACYQVSRNHLVKVVHQLSSQGYLQSKRGRGGGITLAAPASDIYVGDVVRAMEATLNIIDCEGSACPLLPSCLLKDVLNEATQAFLQSLDQYTIADLIRNKPQLLKIIG